MRINLVGIILFVCSIGFLRPVDAAEFSKTIKLEHVAIDYQFKDKRSLELEPEITRIISKTFLLFTEFFGGLPRDELGETYSDFSVHFKHGKHLGGEADPKIVMITWNENEMFGFASWQTLLIHELFHLWNAESFRYQDGREQWFNEGVSEFYTYKTALQLGLISSNDMLSIATSPVGFYISSVGLGEISMREAGATNQAKFDNYFLVYHGGWLAAMILDHDIRKQTKGKRSLDDLMRWLYKNYQRNEKLYAMDDLLDGLLEVTGINYDSFFKAYIDGKMTIPVSDLLPLSDAVWAFKFKKQSRKNFRYIYQTLGILTD
jgi:predicted metalloprotease with PDZ domain